MGDQAVENGAVEHEVIERVRGGDIAAFDDLARTHTPAVLRYAAALVANRTDAEDVAQEVLLIAWRRRADLNPEQSALPWLLVTTRFVALAANRRHVRNDAAPLEAVPESYGWLRSRDQREAAEELASIREVVEGLPDRDRQLVQLCLVEGRSFDEASLALGLKPPAARKRMQRLREQFRVHRIAAAPQPEN